MAPTVLSERLFQKRGTISITQVQQELGEPKDSSSFSSSAKRDILLSEGVRITIDALPESHVPFLPLPWESGLFKRGVSVLRSLSTREFPSPEMDMPQIVRNIWQTGKMRALLAQPIGSPVELTREEALKIVQQAAGRRPDLEPGKAFVEKTRELLGHSLIERLGDIRE